MDLSARKYHFIQELLTVNEEVMDSLEAVLKKAQEETVTVEEYNQDIDQGIKEIENGEFYTQDEARKIASKW